MLIQFRIFTKLPVLWYVLIAQLPHNERVKNIPRKVLNAFGEVSVLIF